MKYFISLTPLLLFVFCINAIARVESLLNINQVSEDVITISIDNTAHLDYGVKYPITFQFNLPDKSTDLSVYKKYGQTEAWAQIVEKTTDDFFNGIEAARFDYENNSAFISVAFGERSDSIYIQTRNLMGEPIPISYLGITRYYDNRDAVVTATADDWADWCNEKFVRSCRIFRDHQLWLSTAIISAACSFTTWQNIQTQIDSGYVEAIAHSRTHPHIPYTDYESEINGCKQDLLRNLVMPSLSRKISKEYVYIWVAPYGDYDNTVESLVSENKFLASRMYYPDFHEFSEWDDELNMFGLIGVSREVGPKLIMDDPWYATNDVEDLNSCFDSVSTANGIYHLMLHPNAIELDKDYLLRHLAHISERKNIWYVATGYLYLYHLIQENAPEPLFFSDKKCFFPKTVTLKKNYPNPFNPITIITYELPISNYVELTVYNLLGQNVAVLVSEKQGAGVYSVEWDASEFSNGIYFYVLRNSEGEIHTRKMMLIR